MREFLGIPYARPPVGALRWKTAVAAAPWGAPFEAANFSAACWNFNTPLAGIELALPVTLEAPKVQDEDCVRVVIR